MTEASKPLKRRPGSRQDRGVETKAAKIARLQRELTEAQEELTRGKHTKYRAEFAARATGLCMLGLTNQELADRFGVGISTIEDWLRDVPEFSKAVYAGREGADAQVANAIFRAAIGYEHHEDDIRTVSLGGNAGSEIVVTPTIKRYAPNDRAASIWINTRMRRNGWSLPTSGSNADGAASPQEQARAAREAIRAAMQEIDVPEQESKS